MGSSIFDTIALFKFRAVRGKSVLVFREVRACACSAWRCVRCHSVDDGTDAQPSEHADRFERVWAVCRRLDCMKALSMFWVILGRLLRFFDCFSSSAIPACFCS
jgi:hypothetical protein